MSTIRHARLWARPFANLMVAISLILLLALTAAAIFAPIIASQDPYDLAQLNLLTSLLPPIWLDQSDPNFFLGSDQQGRDIFSAILYGMRISLTIGLASVVLSVVVGVAIGLWAGVFGGFADTVLMRVADVQLALPAILVAMLIDGVARIVLPVSANQWLAIPVLVFAISLSGWVQYARAVRANAMVEMKKDYVSSARLLGLPRVIIMLKHVMPNTTGPVYVLATVQIGTAIVTEATLSFLGVGMPPTAPSLGSLIRAGYDFLFSGEWWIAFFPGMALVLLVFAVNVLGDWLRDVLNPKLS